MRSKDGSEGQRTRNISFERWRTGVLFFFLEISHILCLAVPSLIHDDGNTKFWAGGSKASNIGFGVYHAFLMMNAKDTWEEAGRVFFFLL